MNTRYGAWMKVALQEAVKAREKHEVPVGAVLVADDKLIAEGWNQPVSANDPSAHAEIVALREAGKCLGNYRFPGTTLYVTIEPCTMCAAAISFARIRRLYYGAGDEKGGAVEHGVRFFDQSTCHHSPEVYSGIGEQAAGGMLREFFEVRRK